MKHDLTGKKFSHLQVLYDSGERSSTGNIIWTCKCDCGAITKVKGSHLLEGSIKSCGCEQHPQTHGMTDSRLYHIWCTMKARCCRESSHKYDNYGKRGIQICDDWKNDFTKFYQWAIENGYSDELSIDRIDNDGDYCPENCRWATRIQQANNTRTNRFVNIDGKSGTIAEMARLYEISPKLIYKRLRLGWTVEKAFHIPVGNNGR